MFDVYLNEKRDRLLVIARGHPVPIIDKAGRWRIKKSTVAISDEIKTVVQRDGFYWRSLRKGNSRPSERAISQGALLRHSADDGSTCHTDAGQS
jgi:hypothetical protein